MVLVGAGISTNCGIPDFRSENGIYNKENNLNLMYQEQLFDIECFYQRPAPFYIIGQKLNSQDVQKQIMPSYTHFFIKQLENIKQDNFCIISQNIDDLEKSVKIQNLYQVHGSFSSPLHCKNCRIEIQNQVFQNALNHNYIVCCSKCGKILKPDIVFYGEDLACDIEKIFDKINDIDTLLIFGTSLQVAPVSYISDIAKQLKKNRILINNQLVGGIKTKKNDIALIDDCDKISQQLAKELKLDQQIQQNIKEYKEKRDQTKKQIEQNQQLKYAIIMNSLIFPTMKFIRYQENIYSVVQINEDQEYLLKQYEYKEYIQKDKILEQFYQYFEYINSENIKIYNKIVKHNGNIVYSPLGGDIQQYCNKIIISQNQNLLDMISSSQETHKIEEYFYQDCHCLEGYLSYLMLIKFLINNTEKGKLLKKNQHELQIEEYQYLDQCDYAQQLSDEIFNQYIQDNDEFLQYQIQEL